jgi:hypothetical protein
MRQILSKLIRVHPFVHETAVKLYVPLERQVGRIRRKREFTAHQQTVRRVLAPRLKKAKNGSPRILFISTRGLNFHHLVDGIIAHGLQFRGAHVEFFTCGGGLALCDLAFEHLGVTPTHCDYCTDCSLKSISAFGNGKPYTLKGLLSEAEIARWADQAKDLANPEELVYKGVPVGELVGLSVRYIMCCCNLPDDPRVKEYWARMAVSACMLVDAFERMLEQAKPDRLFIFNGMGFPEKVIRFMAERRGLPYTTYEMGLRPHNLGFAQNGVSNLLELGEQWEHFAEQPLTPEQSKRLDDYLDGRWNGGGGIEMYWPSMESDQAKIRERLNIPPGANMVAAFSNVIWDTAAQEAHLAFDGMMDWLRTTVEYFGKHRPDDILCVRVHPAEARFWVPTNEKVVDELNKLDLPPNLRIIGPDEDFSSYELARMSSLALVYISTMGMEMALMGRSVIVGGKPHYHGKGFTQSPRTREEYLEFLAPGATPPMLTAVERERARRYAYSLWFRFCVNFTAATIPAPAQPELDLAHPERLEPGGDPEFDLLCRVILGGQDTLTLRREAEERA